MQDHVGARDQLGRADGQQARGRPARRRRGRRCRAHAIASARASRSAAPAGSMPLGERIRGVVARDLVDQPLRAVGQADERPQSDAARARVHADRRVAGGAEPGGDGALGVQRGVRGGVVDAPSKRRAGARLDEQAALAGRGDEDVALERRARPRRRGPAARAPRRPARARRPRRRRACAAACRRCRAARPPRGPAAPRAAARAAAARSSRRARPRAARRATARRPARRAGPRAAGPRRSRSRSASSPGTSLALCTATSISPSSSARSSAPVQRDLSPTAALQVARGRDLHDLHVARRAAPPPSAPARARARCPRVPSRSAAQERRRELAHLGRGAAPPRRARRRARTARAAARAARGAGRRRAPGARCVGSCSSRLTAARSIASTRSRSRSVSPSQRGAFSASSSADEPVGLLAQRGDRRQHLERPEPARERLDLLLDDALGAARLDPALVVRARDLRLQAVDVDQRHARQRARSRVDVARHREVEQQQRPAAARRGDERELLGADDRVRRGGRGDDDVGALELRRAARRTRSCRRRSAGRARSRARAGGWRRTSSRRPARTAPARSARRSRRRR